MMFKMDNTTEAAGGSSWKQFYSCECGVTDYMPTLTIEYWTQSTIPEGYSVEVNIIDSDEKQIFNFTPSTSGLYVLQSSNSTGDPEVVVYDTYYGETLQDDNSGGYLNFRLSVYLHANNTYPIVAGHFGGDTGSYYLTVLKQANISKEFYKIGHIDYEYTFGIHGPQAQEFVHLGNNQVKEEQKWMIERRSDGYYTIRSLYGEKKYIGISNTNTGVDNIRLFPSVSDNTKWSIY